MSRVYPWHFVARWPYYFLFPVQRNRVGMPRFPLTHRFFPNPSNEAVRLVFAGDFMVTQGDRVPELHPQLVSLIGGADLFVATLESPVGPRPLDSTARYLNRFQMSDVYFDAVTAQFARPPGTTALSVAANHAGDYGREGFTETLQELDKRGFVVVGRHEPASAGTEVVECRGLRLGLVAWTHWMQPGEPFTPDAPGIVRSKDVRSTDWHTVREREGIDSLIGLPHWGYEFRRFPEANTRSLARDLIESNGFSLIAGSHPHIIQPVEWFSGGLCAYSLGNFIFTQGDYCRTRGSRSLLLNPLLEVELVASDGPRKGQVAAYRVHPFVQEHNGDQIKIVPLSETRERDRRRHERALNRMFDPAIRESRGP